MDRQECESINCSDRVDSQRMAHVAYVHGIRSLTYNTREVRTDEY